MKKSNGHLNAPIQVIAYHGSGNPIHEFDYQFTGIGNDQIGSGFYFTTDFSEAIGYTSGTLNGEPKPGGTDNPTVHQVKLTLNNTMPHDLKQNLTAQQARQIILAAPELDDALWNWGDLSREKRETIINKAAKTYAPMPGDEPIELLRQLHPLANDFFDGHTEAFNRAVQATLGFDSISCSFEDGKTHFVAFYPEQIEIIEHVPAEEALARIGCAEEAPTP